MPDTLRFARGSERRRVPRGGRRAEDREGSAPLVLLIGNTPEVIERSEAILAKLRFAVTTSPTVDDALRVLAELRPDIVVSEQADAARVRAEAPQHIPVIVASQAQDHPAALIDVIRSTLRTKNPQSL